MEETIITQDTEVNGVVEGSVEAEVAKVEPKKPDTVPLSVYLELKEDLKTLKHEIKEAKEKDKDSVSVRGAEDIAKKYPDVGQEFIKDILSAATASARNDIEAKYNPILERQEQEKKQREFDKAFDSLYEKSLAENPELPKDADKDLIKELALTPKYRNVPVVEIIKKVYGTVNIGKGSSENDVRNVVEDVATISNFGKMSDAQKRAVLDDPSSRKKYFDWLDSNGR